MRILPARDDALLVEVDDLDQAVALLESLVDEPVPGVGEPVPGARTLLVPFRPSAVSARDLAAVLRARPLVRRAAARSGRLEIPTAYDGEDLAAAADLLGWSPEELVRRHSGLDWVVGFMGFAPGFAYLTPAEGTDGGHGADGGEHPAWADVPRRPSPRTHVPAGSVALAGRYSGVYPRVSPGGWQLVGRTDAPMWDTDRDPAALWAPGDVVRFTPVREVVRAGADLDGSSSSERQSELPLGSRTAGTITASAVEVVAVGAQALVQDLGRPGLAHLGVSASGALDAVSLRAANRAVGNPAGAAGLEVVGGVRLRARRPQVVALAGAVGGVVVRPRDGEPRTPATGPSGEPAAFALDDGDELRVAAPPRGARTYLAVRGGLDVPAVLGSRSTDVLADLGPAPLAEGDVLPVGAGGPGLPAAATPAMTSKGPAGWTSGGPGADDLPAPGDVVTLRLVPGPRHDWFGDPGLAALAGQEWEVTPRSNRVGLRLAGAAIPRLRDGELPSEGCMVGAVQVPPDGLPVLFLADHPLTGGYPVIGAVASDQIPLLGQLPVGARLRFVPTSNDDVSENPA